MGGDEMVSVSVKKLISLLPNILYIDIVYLISGAIEFRGYMSVKRCQKFTI